MFYKNITFQYLIIYSYIQCLPVCMYSYAICIKETSFLELEAAAREVLFEICFKRVTPGDLFKYV